MTRRLVPLFVALLVAAEPADLADFRKPSELKTTAIKAGRATTGVSRQPGHLGVSVEAVDGKLVVTDVQPDSPAAKADIKAGDRILSVGGKPAATVDALRELIGGTAAGDRVAVVVERGSAGREATVTLAAPSAPMGEGTAPPRAILGVQLDDADGKGVLIRRVTPNSPAAKANIKAGDLLVKIDSAAVPDAAKLRDVMSARQPGQTIQVALVRGGKEQAVAVELAADPEAVGPQPDMPSLARWDDRRPNVFRKPVYKLAVILVAFPDVKPNEKITPAEWEKALFSTGVYKEKSVTGQTVYGSMHDYYREISVGRLDVTGKVFPAVEVSKKRNDYSTTANRAALLAEAADAVLKRDGKDALNEFDGLFFVYSGTRVQTQRGGIYWPHKSAFRYNGRAVQYFICPEGGERMGSISVVSHEFGHMLGMPDLYAKPENPGSEGVGVWCTMSTGHGQDGKPLHFSAWCKEQLGWINPAVIDPAVKQKVVLSPVEGSASECVKVLLRPDGSEYLLLENRTRKGYDNDLPAEGLLIWRVVDGKPVLEESHGVGGPDGPRRFLGAVPYPSPANAAFTPTTTPSSRSQKPGAWPVHITNVKRLPDGRVTFWVGYEYL